MFNEYRVFVGDDEEVLAMESGDGYTALCMYLMSLICTFMNG